MEPNQKPLGRNESLTLEYSRTKYGGSMKISRHPNLTFMQAIVAITWFPILSFCVATFVWKADQSNAVVRYVKGNLDVTIAGFFAGWLVVTISSIILLKKMLRL